MKKIWIVGAEGRVGSALVKLLDCVQYQLIETDLEDADISNQDEVRLHMNLYRPDIVINCAGYTDVDACEKNPEKAYLVNALGARNLAAGAQEIGAKMIQLSTDDVFSLEANTPYNEFDFAYPKTIYGKSKYAGEKLVSDLMTRYVIIRSSWVYGSNHDFVSQILAAANENKRLEVSNNWYASPTSAKELAKVIAKFIENNMYGVYHVVCQGNCSRYDFAKEILRLSGKESQVELYPTIDANTNRPSYSVLDNLMLRLSGMSEPIEWKAALKEYIEQLGGTDNDR